MPFLTAYPWKGEASGFKKGEASGFEKGEIVSVDGKTYASKVEAIKAVEALSAPYGIGRDIHVGDTIMAGLACGEPNRIAWDILRNHAAGFAACPDWMSAKGTRMYGVPLAGDSTIISGESGSVTMGFLASIARYPQYHSIRDALGLDENSQVLLISTEGNTDPTRFREVVWDGLYGVRHRNEAVV